MKEFSADRLERLLDTVLKPARYTGGEMNAVCKPFSDADVTFAFCFPDSYEVGMSHLGIKILYDIINRRPWALCERVFMPWPDMARLAPARAALVVSTPVATRAGPKKEKMAFWVVV